MSAPARKPTDRVRWRRLWLESLERREVLSASPIGSTAPPPPATEAPATALPALNPAATVFERGNAGSALLASSQAGGYTTMIDNGPSANRVDIVFLGDGYRAAEIDSLYVDHINTMIDHFFRDGEDPFPRYENFFNVHRIDVISNQSGADKPPEGIFRDTALDAYYYCGGTERLICISNSKATQALTNGLAGANFTAEMKLLTVNDEKYGGSGGLFAVFAGGNPSATEIAMHELGHSFSNLADEYEGDDGFYSGPEPAEVNVTKSASGARWSRWLGYEQPGIGTIGAYEGGRYYSQGIYRPSVRSKMRNLHNPFDAVAREKIILDIYKYVDPLDGWLDTSATVPADSFPWVDVVDPNVIDVEWFVDGNLVAGAAGESFNPADFGFAPGTYTVTARAFDSTDWVRINQHQLEQTVAWTVLVDQPNAIPIAGDDAAATAEDTAVVVDILANDGDSDGVIDPAAVSITLQPAHGAVSVNTQTGAATYTPATDFFGQDEFRYVVHDNRGGASNEATVAITITAVNDAPGAVIVSPAVVAENDAGAIVGLLSAVDADQADTHTFSTSDSRFEIVGDQLQLRAGVSFDHEAAPRVGVSIEVVDSGNPSQASEIDVLIDVENVNEAPTALSLSAATVYGSVQGAAIGALAVVDPDAGDQHSFTFSDDRFEAAHGVLRLKPGAVLTKESDDGLTLEITATDSGPVGLSISAAFALTVLENPNPWHNWSNPVDVDGDGHVAPNDAAIVINRINAGMFHVPPAPPAPAPPAPPPFIDVSNDQRIAPNDVLLIINYIIANF